MTESKETFFTIPDIDSVEYKVQNLNKIENKRDDNGICPKFLEIY